LPELSLPFPDELMPPSGGQENQLKTKTLAACSPLALCLVSFSAHADLEPFTFGASETVKHETNVFRSETHPQSDWVSTTELRAGVDQALGRERLLLSGAVDFNRYKKLKKRNSTGYDGSAELDWSTVGDLSGAFGVDAHRAEYLPGEVEVLDTTTNQVTTVSESNLQTTEHAFARASLGGESRWRIFGGVDATRRKYSSQSFAGNNEHQWSSNLGTSYSTSPDLSFGLTGQYTNGEYPDNQLTGRASKFTVRSGSATTRLQASAASEFNASVGYTEEHSDVLTSPKHFVNGSLNWVWTPPSRFKVTLGFKRSSDSDTGSTGSNTGVVNANNLNGVSINNVGMLDVSYEVTAKVSLGASGVYTQRKYADLRYLNPQTEQLDDANGTTRTTRFMVTAHYLPTRTTDVSCGAGRESRRVDTSLTLVTPAFTNNSVQCTASIKFD